MSMWNAPERGERYYTQSESIEMDQTERRGLRVSSKRLTSAWTDTVTEAFGDTEQVRKGSTGEKFMCKVFDKWGWEWRLNESDRKAQNEGKDIEFRSPKWANFYSGDVKNNMDNYGTFEIHENWLFKVECDRIFHVNPDTGWVVWYSVEDMRKCYDTSKKYMKITTKDRLPFMTARKVTV